MTPLDQQHDLLRRLVTIGDAVVRDRTLTMSADAIREFRSLVKYERERILEGALRLIDAEAACLVELLAALSYARSEENAKRELRLIGFIHPLLSFMHLDLAAAPPMETRR